MTSEHVSVIITCYNLEKFIESAIMSVREQAYAGNIQIIAVDDCSVDASAGIIGRIPGVELVSRKENGGVMRAMLSGIQHAKHDVVLFLDGDDVWHPDKVSCMMERFSQGAAFVTHDLWYMDSQGVERHKDTRVSAVLSGLVPENLDSLIREGILSHKDYVWLGSAFGVRQSLTQLDKFSNICEAFPSVGNCYQDWPLATWVAMSEGAKFSYVDRKLFGYRIHEENYSGAAQTLSKRIRNLQKSVETLKLIEVIMKNRNARSRHKKSAERMRKTYQMQLHSLQAGRVAAMGSVFTHASDAFLTPGGGGALLKAIFFTAFGPSFGVKILEAIKRAA